MKFLKGEKEIMEERERNCGRGKIKLRKRELKVWKKENKLVEEGK